MSVCARAGLLAVGALTCLIGTSIFAGAPLPFEEDFEAQEFTPGILVSDPDWSFDPAALTVEVIDTDSVSPDDAVPGLKSLALNGNDYFTLVVDDTVAAQVRWVDFYVKPVFVDEPEENSELAVVVEGIQSSVATFVKSGGVGQIYLVDGDGAGGGVWVSAEKPISLGLETSQDWVRLTYRLDYATQQWDLFVDGQLSAIDLGFFNDDATFLNAFALRANADVPAGLDSFYAGAENRLFTDIDNDGIDDASDLNPALNDRDADPDQDSLTNIEEFMHGTSMLARDPDSDMLSDLMEVKWGRDPNAKDSDLFHLDGDTWQAGFEPEEGYRSGALDQQLGWGAYGVDVTEHDRAYAVHSEETEVFAEHYFGTDPVDRIWFSFDAKLHAGDLPEPSSLEGRTAAVFAFSDISTLNVLDADSEQWLPYTVEVNPSDWNQYAVYLNYQTKHWDLYLNGVQVAGGIQFRDPELQALSKFKAAMQKSANSTAAAYMDNLKLYSGDDFDADTLGDAWERLYGFNPASSDSDANGTLDLDEDNDADGVINADEYAANANPFSSNSDGDMLSDYLEHTWGRDLMLPETDLGLLATDGAGGLFWQTLFEIDEGYSLGALSGQFDWYSSADVAVTADDTATIASSASKEAYVERYFGTAPEAQIWFSFTGKFFTGPMPSAAELTEPAAAVFGFSAPDTLSVLSTSGNAWDSYPISSSAQQWNDYAVYFDYSAQVWELYQNGELVASDLSFADPRMEALSRFKASLEKAADSNAASYLDLVQVYAGNDFDADGLGDAWERAFGFSPATDDSDDDGVADADVDADGDSLTALEEYQQGHLPSVADADVDYYVDQSLGDDTLYNGQSAFPGAPTVAHGPKHTITAALTSAVDSNIILLQSGAYDETNLSFNGKNLTLRLNGSVTIR